MFDISILREKFDEINAENDKIVIKDKLVEVLRFLRDYPEFDFDILTSIIAVDLKGDIELIYQLYSTNGREDLSVSFKTRDVVPSVVEVYKSAYFDECEIYDLFGINFLNNKNLKRLFMPKSWIGHPLLKSYQQNDERLAWND